MERDIVVNTSTFNYERFKGNVIKKIVRGGKAGTKRMIIKNDSTVTQVSFPTYFTECYSEGDTIK